MIARIGRAPIHKHTLETALDDMGLGGVLGDMGEPKSRQRSVEHLERAVERKLAFDAHLDFTAALFELPGVEAAGGGQAQIDAIMADQILRPLRLRALPEIRRRPHPRYTRVAPDGTGDHILGYLLGGPAAGGE